MLFNNTSKLSFKISALAQIYKSVQSNKELKQVNPMFNSLY